MAGDVHIHTHICRIVLHHTPLDTPTYTQNVCSSHWTNQQATAFGNHRGLGLGHSVVQRHCEDRPRLRRRCRCLCTPVQEKSFSCLAWRWLRTWQILRRGRLRLQTGGSEKGRGLNGSGPRGAAAAVGATMGTGTVLSVPGSPDLAMHYSILPHPPHNSRIELLQEINITYYDTH